ncbi:MAG: hypothetical protein ABWY93_19355 [Mycobacterium sp.]
MTDVDAFVADLAPGLSPPVIRRRDAVLVAGPWLAGVSSVVELLRKRLPEWAFVESAELGPGEAPVAVVFVVSAVAPLTESDCAVLDAAAAHTDVVVAAVSKIDVHRRWRDALAADRQVLAAHDARYANVPWTGVAAAPDLGEVDVDALVDLLETELGGESLEQRNRLRAWAFRLESVKSRYESAATGTGRAARAATLRNARVDLARQRRVAKSERTIALRSQIQQARVQLSYFARNRCTSVRAELQEDAAGITRRTMRTFPAYVARRAAEVVDEVDDGITEHLADVANELGLPVDSLPSAPEAAVPGVGQPPLKSRRLETRLMMLLGAGFGLGVALTLSRIFADLAPGLTVAGAVTCVLVGLVVTVWVVGIRGLLHDRAVLDRWVGEVTAGLRAAVDQTVASRVLAAETALTISLGVQDEADEARVADEVSAIDAELREHAMAGARAAAARDAQVPAVQRALDAVRARLGEFPPAVGDGLTLACDT